MSDQTVLCFWCRRMVPTRPGLQATPVSHVCISADDAAAIGMNRRAIRRMNEEVFLQCCWWNDTQAKTRLLGYGSIDVNGNEIEWDRETFDDLDPRMQYG